jgi:predicted molibdopterin-dependent oxidoreductase YjgC
MQLKLLILMVRIKINNRAFEADENSTILEVARNAGFNIPTLCYSDRLPHYSSCMVCMVKDNRTNTFVPSCSALVQENMDIDISGEEVILLRKKAIELLLSEHRAECEAQCKVVCPASYNIPLMNRLIADGKYEVAIELSSGESGTNELECINCAGYCENACRRKKVDIPVSIRNMQIFISKKISKTKIENTNSAVKTDSENSKINKLPKRFSSRIGKLDDSELQEWLKECTGKGIRSREIPDFGSAVSEAESCMHCDCRAVDDCRLRDLSEEYSIKDPGGKLVNAPIQKKINHNTGLVFENAKCIKCGLCVRLCEQSPDEPALCFINRGFVSIISEPLGEEFDNILKTKSKEVVEICPTGALSFFK